MARPRKSLTELQLNGALQNRPGRYQDRINPKSVNLIPIGRPPAHFNASQRAAWSELLRLAPEATLTRSDRLSLEIVVHLLLKLRAGTAKNAEVSSLSAALSKLGMNPSDRKRLNIEPPVLIDPVAAAKQAAEDELWAGLEP